MPGFILQARRRPEEGGPLSGPDTASGVSPATGPDTGACRIGFTATKKIGNAVVRNRAKRRLRAAADAVLPRHGHAGYEYVLVGRTTTQDRAFAALCDDLQIALKNIHQQRQQRKTVITRT